MSCQEQEFDDLELRKIVYNTIRHRESQASIPKIYTTNDAILQMGLQDVFGESINNDRQELVSPFQCVRSESGTAAHIFHLGCIGIYIWLRCIRTEQGRRPLNTIPCPICAAPVGEQIAATSESQSALSLSFPI